MDLCQLEKEYHRMLKKSYISQSNRRTCNLRKSALTEFQDDDLRSSTIANRLLVLLRLCNWTDHILEATFLN